METVHTNHVDAIAGIAIPHQLPPYYVYDGQEVDTEDLQSFIPPFCIETPAALQKTIEAERPTATRKRHQGFKVIALLEKLAESRKWNKPRGN